MTIVGSFQDKRRLNKIGWKSSMKHLICKISEIRQLFEPLLIVNKNKSIENEDQVVLF